MKLIACMHTYIHQPGIMYALSHKAEAKHDCFQNEHTMWTGTLAIVSVYV
jgi:hypothetical protein